MFTTTPIASFAVRTARNGWDGSEVVPQAKGIVGGGIRVVILGDSSLQSGYIQHENTIFTTHIPNNIRCHFYRYESAATDPSPDEAMTPLQKMVAETVEYYLANGGADVARAEIKNLAPTFSFKDDWPKAYRWAMARIDAFEKAERLKAEEREQTTPPAEAPKPDLSDEHICRALERLIAEEWKGKRLFCKQSHWQAVFRILSDAGMFANDDFDGFDSWVRRVPIPHELRRLYSKQSVKNISQTLFCRPLEKWKYDSKLMKKREPYERMKYIAERFRDFLAGKE